ncbi:hypothetical protein, partial [Shumkonia mesophila]|uniref:hypothetical protein n=1 Tax=Shumkonia mesophila TaxID=2838854 RepID=UPI002934FCA3
MHTSSRDMIPAASRGEAGDPDPVCRETKDAMAMKEGATTGRDAPCSARMASSVSIALTGSGGSGVMTAGQML